MVHEFLCVIWCGQIYERITEVDRGGKVDGQIHEVVPPCEALSVKQGQKALPRIAARQVPDHHRGPRHVLLVHAVAHLRRRCADGARLQASRPAVRALRELIELHALSEARAPHLGEPRRQLRAGQGPEQGAAGSAQGGRARRAAAGWRQEARGQEVFLLDEASPHGRVVRLPHGRHLLLAPRGHVAGRRLRRPVRLVDRDVLWEPPSVCGGIG
mmetsp:Transcript_1515/g.4451  ORF Transcript_1515/g.4451 Transcript_1515/m.4451 type:complete len:214 (-) Transcript_1515:348-989(-)